MEKLADGESPKKAIDYRRDDEFFLGYANNASLESTAWDLKIIFGQTDVALGQNVVVQHTAITIPWNYAKILAYLIQVHIAGREAEDGHIEIPSNIVVAPLEKLDKDLAATLKHPDEGLEAIQEVWHHFVEANPELKKVKKG